MPNKTLEKWEEKTIDEIAYIKGGKRLPKGEKLTVEKTTHPYIRVTDFNDLGTIDIGNVQFITDSIYEQIKNYTITSKDLYISIAGTIGKTGIIPKELDGANLTENACKLVYKNNEIFNKYVYYYTLTRMFTDQILDKTKMTAMPKLALTRLATVKLPVPSLLEQQRIVGILDKAFKNIEKAKQNALQNLNNAKELFKSTISDIYSNLNTKPIKLSSLADVYSGYAFKSVDFNDKGFYQVLRLGNVKQGFLRLLANPVYISNISEDVLSKSLLKKGNAVITQTGTKNKRDYGFVAIVDSDNLLLNQRLAKVKFKELLIPEYFYYYSYTNTYKDEFFANEGGTVGQGNVGLNDIKNLTIPYVEISEQQKIVTQLDELQEQTKKLEQIYEQKIKDLDELKQSILQKAFNGEL